MSHLNRTVLALPLLLIALVGSSARAEEPKAPTPETGPAPTVEPARVPESASESGAAAPEVGLAPVKTPSPMVLQITAVLDNEQAQLKQLKARMAGIKDAATFLAIQREVEKLKVETEIALLRIQSGHARRQGLKAVADRIDAAIEEMLKPVPRGEPIARPAPSPSSAEASR